MAFVPVADGVLVRTSRRMCTTSTLVLGAAGPDGGAAVVVDPAWLPDELAAIADELSGLEVRAGFATHAHHDHLLWHPRYGSGVVRWASHETASAAASRRDDLLRELAANGDVYPQEVLDIFARVTALPDPAAGIPDAEGVLPATEVVVHDGHAPGHAALWLPGPRVLVAGDMLSDVEIPLPLDTTAEEAALRAYLEGLDRLAPYVARAAVLVPGHGTPSFAPGERLDADRRYLDAVLAGRPVKDPRLANPGMATDHERVLRVVRD